MAESPSSPNTGNMATATRKPAFCSAMLRMILIGSTNQTTCGGSSFEPRQRLMIVPKFWLSDSTLPFSPFQIPRILFTASRLVPATIVPSLSKKAMILLFGLVTTVIFVSLTVNSCFALSSFTVASSARLSNTRALAIWSPASNKKTNAGSASFTDTYANVTSPCGRFTISGSDNPMVSFSEATSSDMEPYNSSTTGFICGSWLICPRLVFINRWANSCVSVMETSPSVSSGSNSTDFGRAANAEAARTPAKKADAAKPRHNPTTVMRAVIMRIPPLKKNSPLSLWESV